MTFESINSHWAGSHTNRNSWLHFATPALVAGISPITPQPKRTELVQATRRAASTRPPGVKQEAIGRRRTRWLAASP